MQYVSSDLDLLLGVATPDIRQAIEWLLAEGAEVTRKEDPQGMAFALAEFSLGVTEIRMVRDRGVWGMDLRLAGGKWLMFDVIHRILTGEAETHSAGEPLPAQTRTGVSWREHLPAALVWLSETPDAVDQWNSMATLRARELWPPTSRERS